MQQGAALDPSPVVPTAPMAGLVRTIRDDGTLDPAARSPELLATGVALHRHLVRARAISARMIALQRSERIGYHTSSIGEEAGIVGSALATRAADWVFPGARDWYAALVRGLPVATYVHHCFGSADDPARGHASPDHAPARAFHVVPPSGVIGAHLPQAVGAAWAARIRKDRETAALALFGSEVAETGDFHNAMNFAGVFKAPVVFACRAKVGRLTAPIADRAVAYGLASARVDSADALAVHGVVRAALARADAGRGATLIEIVSAPLAVGADGALRVDDLFELGERDPIVLLRKALLREHAIDAGTEPAIVDEVRVELEAAIASADRAGPPARTTIFDDVYAGVPAHLAAQRQSISGGKGG
jgi:pyruvate dehydrogenase E1 component alpha subunit